MIKAMYCLAIYAVLLMTTSCGTTQAVRTATNPTENEALVYFIRDKYPPYIHPLRISSNGNPIATLKNNDYVAVNLPIGVNKILADVTDGHDFTFDLTINKPEVIYFVLTGSVRKTGMEIKGNYINIELETNLHNYQVTKSDAELIVSGFGKQIK
jgi:hypothetical protein